MKIEETTRGTIKEGEYHPAANSAMQYVQVLRLNFMQWGMWKESMASNAIEGNRLAEICIETMERIEKGEPVSDRYLLGLAWTLRELTNQPKEDEK